LRLAVSNRLGSHLEQGTLGVSENTNTAKLP
jgi:hypothetical protein